MTDAAPPDRAETPPVFRRRVFYIPGYDPIHPRRYRELYRREGQDQAKISGYHLELTPKKVKGPYGWHVNTLIDGARGQADIEVLVWADIVKSSMERGIAGTYLQLVRTAWAYIGSGALFRLAGLRKGPMIAALYPIVFLLVQLLLSCLAGWGLGLVISQVHPILGWAAGLALVWAMLRAFKRWDNKVFAYYLMHDYAYSAQAGGANPPELEARMARFRQTITEALAGDFDEVLVVGHSSGAHLAVSILSDIIRAGLPEPRPALAFFVAGAGGADGVLPAARTAASRRSALPCRAGRAGLDRRHCPRRWLRLCAVRSGGGDGRCPCGETLAAGDIGCLHANPIARPLGRAALAVFPPAFPVSLRL